METNTSVMHDFSDTQNRPFFTFPLILFLTGIILLGVTSGYLLSKNGGKIGPVDVGKVANGGSVQVGKTYGSTDTQTYKDTAEGIVKEGGVEGEGQYHLVRPGGESQNVYMTSSNVDLSQFIDRKVKVWGATQKAQKVGWLMDVGRVEVLE